MKAPLFSNLLTRLGISKRPQLTDSGTTDASTPRDWSDDLTLTLKTLQDSYDSKSYGRVHAITFSNFRDSLGPLWTAHEEKILLIAETTIDRMLGRDQTAIRQDDETWLLILPDLPEAEARAFADSVSIAIGNKLIGARFDENEDTDPVPGSAMVDLSQALNEDGSLNREGLKQAVAAARAVMAAQTGREIRERARKRQREIAENNQKNQSDSNVSKTVVQNVEAEQGLKIVYKPAWSADSQAIDSFYCRPRGADGSNPFNREDPLLVVANSIAFTRACTVALNAMIKDNIRAKLTIPIPFQVLLSPAQHQIANAFRRLEESHRFLYLRPEIVGVPHSASSTDLLNIRDFLEPIGRNTCILLDAEDVNRTVLSIDRIMLGFDFPNDTTLTADHVIEAIERIQKIAGKRSTYALGLQHRAVINKAINLGVSEVGGSDLAAPLKKRPTETVALPKDQFLSLED